jgi:hypothetical protein
MRAGHPTEDELVLFCYGDSRRSAAIEAHLESCPTCLTSLQQLRRTLTAVEPPEIPEPDGTFEARIWARIQPRLAEQHRPGWLAFVRPSRLAFAGAVAVVVIAAFVAGRFWPAPKPPAPTAVAGREPAPDRILLVAVGDHLERSQIALVELVNSPAEAGVDISAEQDRVRDLVSSNRLYRQTAARDGETALASSLDDLERVMVEIVHSPSRLSAVEFEAIRQRIESQDVIFKVRVLGSQVRDREQATARELARSSL